VTIGLGAKLVAAVVLMGAPLATPRLEPAARAVEARLAMVLPAEGGARTALEPHREPPAGSGAEFTRYVSPPQLHNGFLAGGLLVWTSALIGGLLLLEKRRLAALTIAGSGVVVGVALMFTGVL